MIVEINTVTKKKKPKLLEIIFLNSGDSMLINSTIKSTSLIAVFLELINPYDPCLTVTQRGKRANKEG